MQNLKIALIQSYLYWESFKNNLQMFSDKLDMIEKGVNLIVFPEMFSTGFSMNPNKVAQRMDGETVEWLLLKSEEKSADIVGSIVIKEKQFYYNRLIWVKANGEIYFYDKKHMFRYAGEHEVYKSGNDIITVDCLGWKICPFICYDLRFPIWTRNTLNKYDLALFVANWPASRSHIWKSLLVARAVENQSYVVGVNRIGLDGNNLNHIGESLIVNPEGNIIKCANNKETILKESLNYNFLKNIRSEFPVLMDVDVNLLSFMVL